MIDDRVGDDKPKPNDGKVSARAIVGETVATGMIESDGVVEISRERRQGAVTRAGSGDEGRKRQRER